MKKLFFTLSCIILAVTLTGMDVNNSEGFTTRIEISGFQDSTALIARIHDGDYYSDWRFDTIYVINGIAELHDVSKAKDPVRMYVFTDSGSITTYVQNGRKELISGKATDIEREALHYSGAPWSEDMMIYNNEVGRLRNWMNKKSRRFRSMSDDEKQEVVKMSSKIDSLERGYFRNYPNSWHGLSLLETRMMDIPKSDVQKIYDSLATEQRESKYGETLKKYLSIETIELGSELAAFNIIAKDQDGNEINMMKVKEPYILLDFSQRYCGPCKAASKEIHEIKDKYAGKVAFINYSCDDSEQDWKKMVERDNITWPSIYNGEGSGGTTCLKFGVNSYPTFFLFGPERTLIDRREGYGPGMLNAYLNSFIK